MRDRQQAGGFALLDDESPYVQRLAKERLEDAKKANAAKKAEREKERMAKIEKARISCRVCLPTRQIKEAPRAHAPGVPPEKISKEEAAKMVPLSEALTLTDRDYFTFRRGAKKYGILGKKYKTSLYFYPEDVETIKNIPVRAYNKRG